jgi:hypothetical protein
MVRVGTAAPAVRRSEAVLKLMEVNTMKMPALLCVVLLLIAEVLCQESASYKPKVGYVPDATTATRIAEAVLIPVYGKKQIESERPFTATLE